MKKVLITTLVSSSLFASTLSFAQDSVTPVNEVKLQEQKTSTSFKKSPWSISYFGDFAGPSLENIDVYQADYKTRKVSKDPVELYNEITPSYSLGSGFKLYAKALFTLKPLVNENVDGYEMFDPKVGIARSQSFFENKLFFYANLSTIIPSTEYAQKKGFTYTPASFQVTSYQLTSNLSLRSLSQIGFKFYNKEDKKGQELYKVEFAPGFVYRFNDKWDSEVFYTYKGKNYSNTHADIIKTTESGAGLGFSWKPVRELKINPQLRVRRLDQVSAANTDFGILFFGDIL